MLAKINNITTAFIVTLLFVWLSQIALQHVEEQGYIHSVFDVLPAAQPTDTLLSRLIQVESGGNLNAVSAKGAKGITQIMPATAKKPGFGVPPLRNNSKKEQIRFTEDYLNAMIKRYGNIKLALAAYNCGPTCADSGNLPKETREYIKKILEN